MSFTGVSDEWQFSQAFDPDTGMVVLTSLTDARPVSIPGDYNGDGIVDAADYTVWRDTLGQADVGLAADGDGSGVIDDGDYTVWQTNFGAVSFGSGAGSGAALPSASPLSAAVPEPTSLTLAVLGFVVAGGFTRRNRLLRTVSAAA